MRGKNIVNINGRSYDAISGMPVPQGADSQTDAAQAAAKKPKHIPHPQGKVLSDVGRKPAPNHSNSNAATHHKKAEKPAAAAAKSAAKPRHAAHAAKAVHKKPQRSQTLQRAGVKRPAAAPGKPVKNPHQRSAMIHKFAPASASTSKPSHAAATAKPRRVDTSGDPAPDNLNPRQHAQHQAHANTAQTSHHTNHAKESSNKPTHSAAHKQGRELKEHLINNRMQKTDHPQKSHKKSTKRWRPSFKRRPNTKTITAAIAALVVLGGYMTYLNMPGLSIRVAATRANVNASYPSYQPAGYSFAGPVAFSPGKVRVHFKSNTNDYNYSLVQQSSNWNSQAVLDNYVRPETDQYATLQQSGLTIFVMPEQAAWVNGGTLYVIKGDAPLSSEQIQKIASSTL